MKMVPMQTIRSRVQFFKISALSLIFCASVVSLIIASGVKQHGISVFLMPSGMLGTLLSLVDVLPLFSNSAWGQRANIAFLEKYMGATFEKRPQPWVATINPEDVHSGDFLAVSNICGRWGGFETLEKWVIGAFAGHTTVCLKDEDGNLWVGESGHENERGEDVIAVIPWDEWWELALKDGSNPQIALLPLHPDVRAKFNFTAAWECSKHVREAIWLSQHDI